MIKENKEILILINEERLKELGYTTLSAEDIQKAFDKFKVQADKKKVVLNRD